MAIPFFFTLYKNRFTEKLLGCKDLFTDYANMKQKGAKNDKSHTNR
jgi:hypothetical protein